VYKDNFYELIVLFHPTRSYLINLMEFVTSAKHYESIPADSVIHHLDNVLPSTNHHFALTHRLLHLLTTPLRPIHTDVDKCH
jgi:hypothetical protein